MKKQKLAFILASLLTLILVVAGCGSKKTSTSSDSSKPLSGKTYTVAINATFAPFESTKINKNTGKTEYVGFDMDLLKQMSKDLGFKYKIKNMEFKGLVGALQSGRADMVISGISPTAERKKSVDFTDAYFTAKTAALYKKKTAFKTNDSLKGVKVAAVFGTEYDDLAKADGAKTTSLDSSPAALQELNNGNVKAVIMDASQAALKSKENSKLGYSILSTENKVSSQFAIALPKNSKNTKQFNKELKKLQDNGTIKKLTVKWMGKEFVQK
ncbi:transporter substrate-binding domain-containing protein [Paucilactobacillus sp. N302-9]